MTATPSAQLTVDGELSGHNPEANVFWRVSAMLLFALVAAITGVAVISAVDIASASRTSGTQPADLQPADLHAPEVPALPCRHGYNIQSGGLAAFPASLLSQLASGHTYLYRAESQLSNPTGQEFYQSVGIRGSVTSWSYDQSLAAYQAAAQAYPGSTWLIANEPDNAVQDNMTPETFAVAYHDARQMVLGFDPTARTAFGQITQATPLRLEWLDRVVARYQLLYGMKPPADVLTVHGYQFREVAGQWGAGIPVGLNATQGIAYTWADTISLPRFAENIIRMREWMAANGYRSAPLFVTEYGPGDPASYAGGWPQVATYTLTETMGFMRWQVSEAYGNPLDGARLVQRWNFFILSQDEWTTTPDSYLIDYQTLALTPLGAQWQLYVRDPRSGLAPCGPGLENAVREIYSPLQIGGEGPAGGAYP